jgi:hypothetical protein
MSQVSAFQAALKISKIVSPQPELKLTDTYGNPFTGPVRVRAYTLQVISSSFQVDKTKETTLCGSSDDCYVQAGSCIQFKSLALNFDNVIFPRSYEIYFEVTELSSSTTSVVKSNIVKVPSTKPALELTIATGADGVQWAPDPLLAPAELTAGGDFIVQAKKAGGEQEEDIMDCVINVSLIPDPAFAIGRPVFENASKTSEILVRGKAIFNKLYLNAAGRYRMAFDASPIIMNGDANYYFDEYHNFLSVHLESVVFEVSPGDFNQLIILQQPQDEQAQVGCVDGLACPDTQTLSYMSLRPNPSVSPADTWGNGIFGIQVKALIAENGNPANAFLQSISDSFATSSDWKEGGIATFTDITVVPRAANILHQITFEASLDTGVVVTRSATSRVFTAGFLKMTLSGHTNFRTTVAGKMLPAVLFRVVDHRQNIVTTVTSPVSAAVFTFEGENVGDGVIESPDANGQALFPDLHIDQTGTYYVRFTYLDMFLDSNIFNITSGNPVALIMEVQPNHVHVNQSVFPTPVVVMHDVFGNRAIPQGSVTIKIRVLASNPSVTASRSSVRANADGKIVISDLRFTSKIANVSLMFWSEQSNLESVLTKSFSVTATEPKALIINMQQPPVLAAEWLNRIRVVVNDHFGSKLDSAVNSGILQDGGLAFVILARSARFDDEYYTNMMLVLVSGPGAGQSAKITAFHGASRRASVILQRRASSTTRYEIRYVVKLRVASLNEDSVDLSRVDTVITNSLPPKPLSAFFGPDEATVENGEAVFVGIWMQRAGTYTLRAKIDPPAYLTTRVEVVSSQFIVGPRDATGFYVSPFGDGSTDSFSAGTDFDETIPLFFVQMHDVYGNDVKDGESANTEFRLQAVGGTFAPRAPGYEIPRTNDPFTVVGSPQQKANGTVVVATAGKAIFDGLEIRTTGRGFSFLISAELYAPVQSSPFSIFPGEPKEIIVLRQPRDFKLSPVNQGVFPSQPRIAVLDTYSNSLVVEVRVDLVRGTEKCGILESLQLQDLERMDLTVEDLWAKNSNCSVELSSNPYVGTTDLLGIDDGIAEFTDLRVQHAGVDYQLTFKARTIPPKGQGTSVVLDGVFSSKTFSVFVGEPYRFRLKDVEIASFCVPFPAECIVAGEALPSFSLILVDAFDNTVEGKNYQGLRCRAQIPKFLDTSAYKSISGEKIFIPVLNGTTTVDVIEGVATFTELVIYQVSTFKGENTVPVVYEGSWVLEFLEPEPEPNHPSLFPGNTFTSKPFMIASGSFHALGVDGFGSSVVYVMTDIPTLMVSGIDRYGNFAPGAEGIVVVELSNVDEKVILYGESPVDPRDDRLRDFKKRLIVDGKAKFDKLMIKYEVPGAILTFWLLNEDDDRIRDPKVVLDPFPVKSVGTLRVTDLPSGLSNAGSVLSPAPSVEIVSTELQTLGQRVAANIVTRVRLYDVGNAAFSSFSTPLLKGTRSLDKKTEAGVVSFTDLAIDKAGKYQLVFNIVYESGGMTADRFSEEFRVGPANGGVCAREKPCQITILRQPPKNVIVTEIFDVEVLIQDFYQNSIDTGSASIAILNNPTGDKLLGNVDDLDLLKNGRVTFTGLHTLRSCNPSWCQDTAMKGYTLVVTKESAEQITDVVHVFSLPVVDQYEIRVRTDQEISAGKRMKYLPSVLMQDTYNNLVVTDLPPRRWTLSYEGQGCLPCRVVPPCGAAESSSLESSVSVCKGAAHVRLGSLDILVEAPTIVGGGFKFMVSILTWEGEPLHEGVLVSNSFSVLHTDTKLVKITQYPRLFPHLVAGMPFSIDVEMFDRYGNAVTSGILKAALLGPDSIEFDLRNCTACSTSAPVTTEGGASTTITLQITQMQMQKDLEIALTHFGTGLLCTASPFEDVACGDRLVATSQACSDEDICLNPDILPPGSCPNQVTVLSGKFRILNAPANRLVVLPLPSSMRAGTTQTVYLQVLDRYNNLLLDVNSLLNVDVSIAAYSAGYAGLFPELMPLFATSNGQSVSHLICNACTKLHKGSVEIDFPAPLVVSDGLELVFSVSLSRQLRATYWGQDIELVGFRAISNTITILPGDAKRIIIAPEDISNFNRFGHPLYRQPCVSITDSENNPAAPNLLVEVHICAANASVTNVVCEIAGIAETTKDHEVCFSDLEISRPPMFNIGVAYYYFTFVAGSLSMRSSSFTVYDVTGLQIVQQPVRSRAHVAMLPAPEVWLCFGTLPCNSSSKVPEWPHMILVDLLAEDGEKIPEKLAGAAIRQGAATFGNLTFRTPGNNLLLSFALHDSGFIAVSDERFSIVSDDVVHINITSVPDKVRAGQPFDISIDLLDFYMHPLTSSTVRSVNISLADECSGCAGVSLSGARTVTAVHGRALFTGLSIKQTGRFQVQIRVPGTSGMVHGLPDVAVSNNITIVHSQSYMFQISQQPVTGTYGQALPVELRLVIKDEFGNAAVDLNGRQVRAMAECVTSCPVPVLDEGGRFLNESLAESNALSSVSNERAIFEGLTIHLTQSAGSTPPSHIRLRFMLCSLSGDCPMSASVFVVSNVFHMAVPKSEPPQDPFIRVDVQPTSTMIANYSSSFRPQISVLDSEGSITKTSFTVFITLIRGQFLGTLALSSKLEMAPRVASNVVIVDDIHAKVDTVNGRADFNGIMITGSPGENFRMVFTRCHLGSSLTKSLTGEEMCNWIDTDIGSANTRRSAPFSVTNAQLFYMHILQTAYPVGQAVSGRLITLSDRPLTFGVRVDDVHQMAIGSRSYIVRAQLMNFSGHSAPDGVLQGQTAVMTKTGFAAQGAGEAFFTDLRVTKIGEGWKIRFFAIPDCIVDFPAMRALACDDVFRQVNIVEARSRPIDVGHDSPVNLEFVSEPRNVTSRYVVRGTIRPWVEVRVLDKHRNPVTCSVRPIIPKTSNDDPDAVEPTLSETLVNSLLASLLPVCNTTLLSPLGQFHLEMSLLMSNNPILGTTSAATDYSVATFSNLMPTVPAQGIALQAKFKVPSALERVAPELLGLEQKSKPFNIWATSFDELHIAGCPMTTESYEAGSKYDKLEISGVFARSPSGLLHASVEGTCTNRFGCQPSDIVATMASVYLFDGSNPGKLECADESLCLQPGGPRHIHFQNTKAFFRDFMFPTMVTRPLVVRLAVTSPFDGRHLYVDCASVTIVSGDIAALHFVNQPSAKASAGEAILVQPSLKLVDKFGNVVIDPALALSASMCLPCPCPCDRRQLPGSTPLGLPCVSNKASSWSPMGQTPAECVDKVPALDGNVQQNTEGLVGFRNLRVTTSGNNMVLLFVTNVDADINITSRSFDVSACTPHVLKLSALSPLCSVENPGDTGVSFCNGPCILEIKDLFGNLVIDASITIEAVLTPTPSTPLAGFSTGESCACTKRNVVYGVGAVGTDQSNTQHFDGFADASYGMYCNAWDTYKADCAKLWPNCSAGLWCCRPWCYVSKSCPSAISDTLVTGLFYSYEACSPNPDLFWKCPYRKNGICSSRDADTDWHEVESLFEPETKLRSSRGFYVAARRQTLHLVNTVSGRAVFTDLHTTHPGRYTLTFKGFFGSQLLFFSKDIGVTPLFARKLRVVTPPNNKTTTGNPLTQQPSVIMLDQYNNPVVYSKVCQAVTASVVSWSGKNYDDPGDGARFVFGQTPGDMNYYPRGCDTDIQNDCIVTSNAQSGLASFSWMNIGGGPSPGIVLNFTTGCCNSDPNLCYCADPLTPSKVDSLRTEPVRVPCSFVESPVFTLKMPVAKLFIETQPRALYRSGENIDLAVSFRDENGKKVLSASNLVSAVLYRQKHEGYEPEDALVGDVEVEAEDGTGTFRNISLHKLRGEYRNGIYSGTFVINVTLVGYPDVSQVRSRPFTVQPGVPVEMLPWDDTSKTYRMPLKGFTYTRLATLVEDPNVFFTFVLYDKFGNLAPAPNAFVNASVVDTGGRLLGAGIAADALDLTSGGEDFQGVALEGIRSAAANNELIVCCQASLQWAGTFNVSFLFSMGGIRTDLRFKVVNGPADRLYVTAGFSGVIIAWETFRIQLEVVDSFGNFVSTHSGFDIIVSATIDGFGDPLNDEGSIQKQVSGCSAKTNFGFVLFTECRAKEVAADANLYPNGRLVGEMTFTGKKDETSTFPPLRQKIEILPPVVQLWVSGCLTKDREDAYNGTVGRGCSRNFLGQAQASKEPFFYYPRVELRDSAGALATLSKLQIVASVVEPTPLCVSLFGDVSLIANAGIVEFKTTGVTYVETSCQPYNWLVMKMRVRAVHKDGDHMGLQSVDIRDYDNKLITVTEDDISGGFSKSLYSHYTFAINFPVTQLELVDAPEGGSLALAGLKLQPFLSVKLVYEYVDGLNKGVQFLVRRTSRPITVRIYNCSTPFWSSFCSCFGSASCDNWEDDQQAPGMLIGNTTIISVDGYATFANISIVTTGTFYLEIVSQTEADASPILLKMGSSKKANAKKQFFEYVKITAGPLAKLRVLKTPSAWAVGAVNKRMEVELLDEYENRLDCQYGECALPAYGFPSLIGKREWPLLQESHLPVSIFIDQTRFGNFDPDETSRPKVCEASSNFVATEGMCSCLGGSLNVTALEGVAVFDCLYAGMSGIALPLMLSAGSAHLAIAPISVSPGSFSALVMVQNMNDPNAVDDPILFCEGTAKCLGLSVQMVDVCGNLLYVEDDNPDPRAGGDAVNVEIKVTACPESAGIHGTTLIKTVLGKATFEDLRVSRAKNMPCEITDSLFYHDYDHAPCLQTQTPYVFVFSALGVSVASSPFLVDNGLMQTLQIVQQPKDSVQGSVLPVQPQVKLIDNFGNTVTQDNGGGFEVQAAIVTGEGCRRSDQPQCWINCDGTAIGGTCYKFFTLPSTFDQAVAACQDWGGELLTVTSAQTNLGILAPLTGGVTSWIGLKWEPEQQDWMWRDKAKSNTDDYANWDAGEPPLSDQQVTGCVAAKASLWQSLSCERRLPYMCGNDAGDEAYNECNCCSKITGTSTVNVYTGFAAFTDLVIASEPGSGFRMTFGVTTTPQTFAANIFCDGPCDCTPRFFATEGIFDDGKGQYANSITCKYMISTVARTPRAVRDTLYNEAEIALWFTSFDTEPDYDFVYINECDSEACLNPNLLQRLHGSHPSASGPTAVREKTIYGAPTGFLQLVFTTDALKRNYQGFRAQWSVRQTPITKVVPPPPEWLRAASISEQFSVYPRTSLLALSQQPLHACGGQALVYQPHVVLKDSYGDRVVQERINVSVSVLLSSPAIRLLGTTHQMSINGYVVFTNLGISSASSAGVRLRFQAQSGTPPMPLSVDSERFPVTPKADRMFIVANTQPKITLTAGAVLAPVILRMHDAEGYQVFSSNTAVSVTLDGAPDILTTPAGISFLPIFGMTVRTALNGSVTFDQLRISWASPSTRLIFRADHVLLQAISTE